MIHSDGLLHLGTRYLHHHVQLPEDPSCLVVFSHGFASDGTGGHRMFNEVAAAYNDAGIGTLQFDYRGCGYSSGAFSDFTMSGAVEDLTAILDWSADAVAAPRVVVHGHSLGAAIAVLAGIGSAHVGGLILWNLSGDAHNRYPRVFGEGMRTEERFYLPDQGLASGRAFLQDAERHDPVAAFARWTGSALFVNSGADEKSSPSYARDALRLMPGSGGTMVVIDGANHAFKAQPDLQEQATRASVAWVLQQLDPG